MSTEQQQQMYNLYALSLIFAILFFAVVLAHATIRLENLELNRHILEDCKIDVEEYKALKEPYIEGF